MHDHEYIIEPIEYIFEIILYHAKDNSNETLRKKANHAKIVDGDLLLYDASTSLILCLKEGTWAACERRPIDSLPSELPNPNQKIRLLVDALKEFITTVEVVDPGVYTDTIQEARKAIEEAISN